MTSQCSSLISVTVKNTRAKASRRRKGSLGPNLQLTVHHWGKPEQELSQGRHIKASLRLYPSVPLTRELTHSQRSTAESWRMLLVGSQTPPLMGGVLLHQSPQIGPQANQLLGNSSHGAALRRPSLCLGDKLTLTTRTEWVDSWSLFQVTETVDHIPRTGKGNSTMLWPTLNSPARNKGPITAALKCRMSAGLKREELPKPQFFS